MTVLALDASVVLKWVLPGRADEADVDRALAVLDHVGRGQRSVLQPPHWLAEVAAVLSRLEPRQAPEAVALLHAMELPVAEGTELYQEACRLAVRFTQHVFDTLYHAVALSQPDGMLVTADERYYRQAGGAGRVTLLRNYR